VTVITSRRNGPPIHRVNLARGASQLVVIPDEGQTAFAEAEWSRLGAEVEFACLQIPADEFIYHYRLMATIALAEISRQVGRRPSLKLRPSARYPIYDLKLARLAEAAGEWVHWEDLEAY
jgi:hypothetical protein